MKKKIKLYVGCALKNAPKEFIERVFLLRSELAKDPRYEILEFLGPGKPEDIYRRDIHECVANADMMLAVVDQPSLGLGYEMATHCKHFKRPLLAVAHKDSVVSGLIEGIHGEGRFSFARYSEISEVPSILKAWSKS
jgi:hypothetical protein